jgi:hypothetical protein
VAEQHHGSAFPGGSGYRLLLWQLLWLLLKLQLWQRCRRRGA